MKNFIIAVIFVLITSLSACGKVSVEDELCVENKANTEEEILSPGTQSEVYSSVIAQENEFYEIIANNPIDKSFVWEGDVGSVARISKAAQYRDLWNSEIMHTLTILKENLTQEDYEMLETAYESWRQYMDATMSVEQNIFYIGMSYGIGCNDTYPLVMETYAERTKEYAVELMALEYAFTGTVEFAAQQ